MSALPGTDRGHGQRHATRNGRDPEAVPEPLGAAPRTFDLCRPHDGHEFPVRRVKIPRQLGQDLYLTTLLEPELPACVSRWVYPERQGWRTRGTLVFLFI